jgi:hypothetical protein
VKHKGVHEGGVGGDLDVVARAAVARGHAHRRGAPDVLSAVSAAISADERKRGEALVAGGTSPPSCPSRGRVDR